VDVKVRWSSCRDILFVQPCCKLATISANPCEKMPHKDFRNGPLLLSEAFEERAHVSSIAKVEIESQVFATGQLS
jgi:hypothetical protein